MSILMFLLGIIFGFCGKLGFDYYHNFILRQKKLILIMEDIIVKTKALELVSKVDLK